MELIRNHSTGHWDLLIGEITFCSTSTREQGEIVAEVLTERVLGAGTPSIEDLTWTYGFYWAVERYERNLILEALKKSGGKKGAAAELLKMKRTTLTEKAKRYGLDALELLI